MVKDGRKGPLGSGVRGGGVVTISGASSKVAELIHFSSRDPKRGEPNLGGDSGGIIRKISAKWSLINLHIMSMIHQAKTFHALTLIILANHHQHAP